MSDPRAIVRIFGDIVSAVSDNILSTIQANELALAQEVIPDMAVSNIEQINYQFGHLKELITTMKEWESAPDYRTKKYPLVALLMDFPERNGDNGGYYSEVTLQVLIAYVTEPTFKAEERYTKVFEPILLPIYYELLNQIEASAEFVSKGMRFIKHTKIDHPFYGKGGLSDTAGNVFADTVDAIEVQNLVLTTNIPKCYIN